MKKETKFWVNMFHLNEINRLFAVLAECRSIKNNEKIELNIYNQKYEVEIENDNLIIKLEDGRVLSLSMDFRKFKNGDGYNNSWMEYSNFGKIVFSMNNNEKIEITSTCLSRNDRDYHKFKNINLDEMFENVIYINKDGIKLDLDNNGTLINDIFMSSLNNEFGTNYCQFTDEGIVHRLPNHYYSIIINKDGKTLISFDGKKAPSLLELEQYIEREEKQKINKMLEENIYKLNPITIEFIKNSMDNMNMEKTYSRLLTYYKKSLPLCKKMLETYKEFLDFKDKCVFNNLVLDTIATNLEKYVESKKDEIEKVKKNDKIKKLVKKLSPEEIELLRKEIK